MLYFGLLNGLVFYFRFISNLEIFHLFFSSKSKTNTISIFIHDYLMKLYDINKKKKRLNQIIKT